MVTLQPNMVSVLCTPLQNVLASSMHAKCS